MSDIEGSFEVLTSTFQKELNSGTQEQSGELGKLEDLAASRTVVPRASQNIAQNTCLVVPVEEGQGSRSPSTSISFNNSSAFERLTEALALLSERSPSAADSSDSGESEFLVLTAVSNEKLTSDIEDQPEDKKPESLADPGAVVARASLSTAENSRPALPAPVNEIEEIWERFDLFLDCREVFGEQGKVYHYMGSMNMYQEASATIAGEVHFFCPFNMYQQAKIDISTFPDSRFHFAVYPTGKAVVVVKKGTNPFIQECNRNLMAHVKFVD